MEVPKKNRVILFLKLDPTDVHPFPANARDVRNIGHCGTGDFELSIKTQDEVEAAQPLIKLAFEKVGG